MRSILFSSEPRLRLARRFKGKNAFPPSRAKLAKLPPLRRTSCLKILTLALSIIVIVGFMPNARAEQRVGIMTYNVENLFDTTHDPGKEDYTFLPFQKWKQSAKHKAFCNKMRNSKWRNQCLDLDWSAKNLNKKLKRLSRSIRQVNNGRGPDLLLLQEVENINVLNHWRTRYLNDLGYREPVLIEGRDGRGIDVAMMSRFPLVGKPQLHYVPFKGISGKSAKDTRGFLQADFQLPDGTVLHAFSVHFPAPYHDTKFRIQSFQHLRKLQRKLPKKDLVLAAGDFNVTSEEDAQRKMLRKYVANDWMIAHQVHCPACKGTYYYKPKKDWSFLDMILLDKDFNSDDAGWHLDNASVRIANQAKYQRTSSGTPYSFNAKTGKGISDHWPIYLELYKN